MASRAPVPAVILDPPPPPPKHIIVTNHSTLAKDEDVAFWAEAVRLHVQRDLAPAWGIAPPGVFFYGSATNVPAGENPDAAFIGIVDDDGNADSAGYHSLLGTAVFGLVDMGQSNEPSRTLDHEVCEMTINPQLMRQAYAPNNLRYFVEVSDPVEAQLVAVTSTILGHSREVQCSNFVTPAWFGMDSGKTYDQLGSLRAPYQLAPGGYVMALDASDQTVFLSDRAALGDKLVGRAHRTSRILSRVRLKSKA